MAAENRRAAAERRLLHDLATELAAGRMGREELQEIYLDLRDMSGRGIFQRWKSIVPVSVQGIANRRAHQARQAARIVPNGPDGSWAGTMPSKPFCPMPPEGKSVAYLLYDGTYLVYIGSTKDLAVRLMAHRREGKVFDNWKALPCEDRDAAYALETRLIAELDPPLNRAPGRGGGTGGTPVRQIRLDAELWRKAGVVSALMGTTRSAAMNEFMRWITGEPDAKEPKRLDVNPFAESAA